MVLRLWVPLIHWLWARNWKLAASGACSTPLRMESLTWAVVSVVVILVCLLAEGWLLVAGVGSGRLLESRRWPPLRVGGAASGGREQALGWDRPGGQRRGLPVDGGAQLLLELDERRHRRVGGQAAGDLEDLPQRLVALLLIARERRGRLGAGTQRLVERHGQQLGVAERVADAVAGDRVTVIARVPDQRPAGAERLADLVGQPQHALDRRGP